MTVELRRLVPYMEEVQIEGGRLAASPLRLFAAAAVLRNPWRGCGFVEDLRPEIHADAPSLGEVQTNEILRLAGPGDAVEGYGKAAVVGTAGEIGHASALVHLSVSAIRFAEGLRSHYLTVQFSVNDAPAPEEIIVALSTSIGPHHGIGDRYQDLEELGDTHG